MIAWPSEAEFQLWLAIAVFALVIRVVWSWRWK
jgi:hypothetical protein